MRKALWILALLIGAGVLTVKFIIAPTVVVGDSMLPTLRPWDVCWMRRVSNYAPQHGDVIMFRTADDPPLRFIKRVVAVPGETIAIRSGRVVVNQQPVPEPYTTPNPTWELTLTNVPAGRVYVIGDNREVPLDLTVQGLVATRLVEARMVSAWRWKK